MTRHPTERQLNAYVDGELTPHEDARIARAIAEDPAVAARVATLTRLKSSLSELAEQPPHPIAMPRPRRPASLLALAASFGLLLAVGAGILMDFNFFSQEDDAWYREARLEHANWAVTPAAPNAREVEANLILVSLERIAIPVQAPDLTSAKLRLTYLQYYQATDTAPAALHLGYTGQRGCKVTLWVTQAPRGLDTKLAESRVDSLRGFRWRAGRTAYALFATGMAERRFTVIASKVYEASRRRRGFDDGTQTVLRNASSGVPPCQA